MNEWTEWPGGECPCPNETVMVLFRMGTKSGPKKANRYVWKHIESGGDIIAYRIVKEKEE